MQSACPCDPQARSLSKDFHPFISGFSPSLAVFLLLVAVAAPRFSMAVEPYEKEQEIGLIAQGFCSNLGISQPIHVVILQRNPRLISVEFVPGRTDAFQMIFERGFLDSLDRRELLAAVAHEVGHAWIYTHFPYLQTEALANRQALKLVSRSDLERLYLKVWGWKGKRGDLDKVLEGADLREEQSASAAGYAIQPRDAELKPPER